MARSLCEPGVIRVLTLLIAILIIAGTATAISTGISIANSRKRLGGGAPKQLTAGKDGNLVERSLNELRVGDIVQYDHRDFLVEGVVDYDEDGHKWVGARMIDGADVFWLVVGMERIASKTSIRLLDIDRDLDINGYPPEVLLAGGKRYTLDKRGSASGRFHGDVGELPKDRGKGAGKTVERCRWWRYEGTGEDTLLIEQWAGEYRVLRGERLIDGMIEMIPGS